MTKEIAKEVLTTGAKIGADVISGKKTLKESAKQNIDAARKKVAKTVLTNFGSDEEEESEGEGLTSSKFKKPVKRKKVSYSINGKKPKIVI